MLSYRKLAMRVLGRPLHTGGGNDSPRPASQRAAAFILTAAMLTTFTAPAFAGTWYIEKGDITISAGKDGNDVTQNETTTYGDKDTIITNNNKDTASTNTVTIEAKDKDDKVEVKLDNVNIDTSKQNKAAVSVTGNGDTNIELDGDNKLKSGSAHAGLEHNKTDTSGELTIQDNNKDGGSLKATGGQFGAGIGSAGTNDAQVKITGGKITATGGEYGAGIGGGFKGSGDVTITGGEIHANGGNYGAGIGGGDYSSGKVTISGGEINATGGYLGAGIGGGEKGSGDVTITGGEITANGGSYGAGIGGGKGVYLDSDKKIHGGDGKVTITGGKITATSKSFGAGIGGGSNGSGDVTITGGEITSATGGKYGAGIGGGKEGRGDVTIEGNTEVNAAGGAGGAGIGGGYVAKNNSNQITIKSNENGSPTVNAVGGSRDETTKIGGAGIGAGGDSTATTDITLVGKVTINATAGKDNAAIGANGIEQEFPGLAEGTSITRKDSDKNDISPLPGDNVPDTDTPSGGEHTWNEGVVTKEPTCTADGVRTFTCTVCHNTRTEDIEALDHEYGEWVIDRDATCVEEGSKHRDCIRGDDTQIESIPATGQHSYGAGVVTKAATCTETGIMTYTCAVCSDSYTESIPVDKTAHKWDAGVVTKEATCTADGVRTFTCSVCSDTRTEVIKALGHEYKASSASADCTHPGTVTYTCVRCGDSYTETHTGPLGHEYGEWVIDRDATCVEEGSKHRDCIRGDDTQTEAIPVSKTHTFGEWVITKEPTCTEKGEKQRSCTVSGCVVTETEELPALGHQWSDWTPVKGDSSREYRICEVCNEVEYRDVSHNSDSSISTGLRVLDPAQSDILQNAQLVQLNQISDVLYIDVTHETASLQGVLSDLTGLRSERIETVVFSTERCTSTLSLSDVAALGAGDTPFILRHSGSTASFTVGGADYSHLLK